MYILELDEASILRLKQEAKRKMVRSFAKLLISLTRDAILITAIVMACIYVARAETLAMAFLWALAGVDLNKSAYIQTPLDNRRTVGRGGY